MFQVLVKLCIIVLSNIAGEQLRGLGTGVGHYQVLEKCFEGNITPLARDFT